LEPPFVGGVWPRLQLAGKDSLEEDRGWRFALQLSLRRKRKREGGVRGSGERGKDAGRLVGRRRKGGEDQGS